MQYAKQQDNEKKLAGPFDGWDAIEANMNVLDKPTIRALSEATGIRSSALFDFKYGRSVPSLGELERFIDVLGIDKEAWMMESRYVYLAFTPREVRAAIRLEQNRAKKEAEKQEQMRRLIAQSMFFEKGVISNESEQQ